MPRSSSRIEGHRENGGLSVFRDQREPALLGIAEQLVRAMAEILDGKDIQRFHSSQSAIKARRKTKTLWSPGATGAAVEADRLS